MAKKQTKANKASKDDTERPSDGDISRASAEPAFEPKDLADMPGGDEGEGQTVAQVEQSPEKKQLLDMTPEGLADEPGIRVERVVEGREVGAIVHPQVRGGICAFCGQHYSQCKHYRGVELRCSYCPPGKDATEFLQRTLFVYTLPEKPHVLITCCEDYRCMDKHQKRFSKQIYE